MFWAKSFAWNVHIMFSADTIGSEEPSRPRQPSISSCHDAFLKRFRSSNSISSAALGAPSVSAGWAEIAAARSRYP